jgi:Skp family chaperone for outer membrane proteins
MKSTLRYTLVFVVGLLVGLAASAWGLRAMWHHGPPSAEKILSHLDKKLHLTADQKAQALVILTEESTKMQALRTDVSNKFEALRDEGADRMRALLDPKQQAEFDAMKKKFDQHRMDPFAPPTRCSGSTPSPTGAPAK